MYFVLIRDVLQLETAASLDEASTICQRFSLEAEIYVFPHNAWPEELTVAENQLIYNALAEKPVTFLTKKHSLYMLNKELEDRFPSQEQVTVTNHPHNEVTSISDATESRPKSGTVTGKVWLIADEVAKTLPINTKEAWKKFKEEVLAKCKDANPATVQVQLSKWKGSL
jgi:hypothetical protein